jgi:hypothetical protein
MGSDEGSYCEEAGNCYAVAELGNLLPPAFSSSRGADYRWMCVNEVKSISHDGKSRFAETEADARKPMLIYLIESKLHPKSMELR